MRKKRLLVGNFLGILTDRQVDAKEYYMEAGNVAVVLEVSAGDGNGAILIQPNQTTPLSIMVYNNGSKDCYVKKKVKKNPRYEHEQN